MPRCMFVSELVSKDESQGMQLVYRFGADVTPLKNKEISHVSTRFLDLGALI